MPIRTSFGEFFEALHRAERLRDQAENKLLTPRQKVELDLALEQAEEAFELALEEALIGISK